MRDPAWWTLRRQMQKRMVVAIVVVLVVVGAALLYANATGVFYKASTFLGPDWTAGPTYIAPS